MHDGKVKLHNGIAAICRSVAAIEGRPWLTVTHCLQVERLGDTVEADLFQIPREAHEENTWVLTERAINWDRGGEAGRATRILATTHELSHEDLHKVLRGYMFSGTHMTDFGPTHCDQSDCAESKQDDAWLRETMIPEWRRRFLGF